jgi:hypothetical protein
MKKFFNEGNQIHNFISSSGSGTLINYGPGSDFLTSYGSGSTCQKVTVPTVPASVPQRWAQQWYHHSTSAMAPFLLNQNPDPSF